MRLRLVAFALSLTAFQATPLLTKEPQKPLPFEAAFGLREFGNFRTPGFLSAPKGSRIAFVINHKSPDHDRARSTGDRFLPGGTPRGAVGLRVHLSDSDGANETDLCAQELGEANSWRPAWSPDGEKLAFYADAGGTPKLWIYETKTRLCRRVSDARIHARHWGGDEAQWAPDSRNAYVPLKPEGARSPIAQTFDAAAADLEGPNLAKQPSAALYYGGGEKNLAPSAAPGSDDPMQPHYIWGNNADLATIDTATGEVRKIVGAESAPRPSVMRISPSGKWLSYLSVSYKSGDAPHRFNDLAFVPAAGGAPRILAEKIRVPDDYYRWTYRWHPSEDRLVYLKDDRLHVVDFDEAGPAAPRALAEGLGPLTETSLRFTPDGRHVLVGFDPAESRGGGHPSSGKPRRLALVPVDGGAPHRVDLDPGFQYDTALTQGDGVLARARGGRLLIQATHRQSGDAAILTLDMESGAQKLLWRAPARLENTVVAENGDLLALYEDFKTPPDLYRFSSNLRRKSRLTRINPEMAGINPGTAHIFETEIPLYNGELKSVRTAVFLPPGMRPGAKPPTVVFIYPDRDYSREAAQYGAKGFPLPPAALTTRGYAVLYPHVDVGPGGEAGNIIREITDALLPQIYKAAALGLVDIDRLAITGSSFGGFATAAVVSQTNLFRAAIPMNGPYDLGGKYGVFQKGASPDAACVQWNEHSQPRFGAHPWADLTRVIANSPYYQADKIETPMLIIQGEDDMFLTEAQKLFVALRRLDKPVQLAIYEGSGHVLYAWPRAQAVDGAERILEFLDRHVKEARK